MFSKDGVFQRNRSGVTPREAYDSSLHPQQRTRQPDPTPTPTPVAEPKAKESAAEEQGSRLIVGPNIKLKGAEITDCDTLVVEGRVEASMQSRVMQIAQSGVFSGTAGIDVAEIHGRFEGELTVRKRLVIHASGKVSGKIRYGTVSIAEGGEISGDVGALERSSESRIPAAPRLDSLAPAAESALQASAAAAVRR